MTVSPDDYAWLEDDDWSWVPEFGYCVTSISRISLDDVLAALDATSVGTVAGFAALDQAAGRYWENDGPAGDVQLVGFVESDAGVLLLEGNGFVGVSDSRIPPLSAGRDVVAHYRNVNAASRFVWWRDGAPVLDFDAVTGYVEVEPIDEVRARVTEYGLPIDPEVDVEYSWIPRGEFALAERISGFPLTPALLRGELHAAEVTLRV
ncbi:DUF6461 domain-containing protein [Protaetiibacter intestinalis]|uniref:Uncharacterized protein n=1 Tax=Protaetiibacter intestinalis TaxID=2419774 RepID=A0A387B711_9MICO|nr:DUF6461 domain-containing protein [Protaetiibacter intestinalis]AYF98133.1 hypothetical protein D7I47_07630 [Protaetiibacter intestinalis]